MDSFEFEVYNNRRDNVLTYRVHKTEEGWHIKHIAINGNCKPDGSPYFYSNFSQDSIAYPNQFGRYLEHIWEKIESEEIDREGAQKMLQELADWVTACEKSRPAWPGWNC